MDEVKAKTPHGEMTIDQLAEIQPGMAAAMKVVGERYTQTFHAAKGGNWKLAAYHLNQLRAAFRNAKVTRPKYAEDLTSFDREYLQPILEAINDRDWAEFEVAFMNGERGSDLYHEKRGVSYIRYILPEQAPSNLYHGPPEKFVREGGKKEG
ncbi:MAG TPA: hypothetical protein VLY82_00380 [Nitrososphaerales archaeon]|nr:hypothetical protein [Nitrososphaerales archaeon]